MIKLEALIHNSDCSACLNNVNLVIKLLKPVDKLLTIVKRAANNSCCICCDNCLACDATELLRELGEN